MITDCVVKQVGKVLASSEWSAEVHARAEPRIKRPSDAGADESGFLDALRVWH